MSSKSSSANSSPASATNALVLDATTLDAEVLYAQLQHHVKQVCTPHTQMVGITSGGAWLVERLQKDLNFGKPVGVISSSLHRDDYSQRGISGNGQTHLPFEVNGADILLLDDVLYTGRTIRAVVNELFDYGRPKRIQLAVLVDRGGREMPIHADFAAAKVSLTVNQTLSLAKSDTGQFYFEIQSTVTENVSGGPKTNKNLVKNK